MSEQAAPSAGMDPASQDDTEALEKALEATLGERTVSSSVLAGDSRSDPVGAEPERPPDVVARPAADDPPPAQPVAPPETPAEPQADPLAEFFFSEGEHGPALPDFGGSPAPHAEPEEPEPRREYLTFSLGDEQYGLEIARVREILKVPAVTEVPRAPADVLGIISLRGEVIPVLDPRRRLRLPPAQDTRAARILVCHAGAGSCGLLVDAVKEVVRLAPAEIDPVPQRIGGMDAECLTGIGRRAERLVILVDAAALLRPMSARRVEGS